MKLLQNIELNLIHSFCLNLLLLPSSFYTNNHLLNDLLFYSNEMSCTLLFLVLKSFYLYVLPYNKKKTFKLLCSFYKVCLEVSAVTWLDLLFLSSSINLDISSDIVCLSLGVDSQAELKCFS